MTGKTGDDLKEVVLKSSKAAAGLYKWLVNTLNCYEIFKDVNPKRIRAAQMRAQKEQAEKDLAETEANLKEINETLAGLNAEMSVKKADLDFLKEQQAIMERKLNAANRLITGLGSEQKRWTEDMDKLRENKIKLVGDCLLGSSFLSYCGPFNSELRHKMVYEHWMNDIKEKAIPYNDTFRLEKFLTDDVEISKWASEGLPGDELSV